MKNFVNRFKDDPIFAAGLMVAAVTAATGLMNAVGHVIGSSGYAIHAAKRKKTN